MLTRVVRPPPVLRRQGEELQRGQAEAIPGVKSVVPDRSGRRGGRGALLAAQAGRDALEVEWDDGGRARSSTAKLRRGLPDALETPGQGGQHGDVTKRARRRERRIKAEYELPYLAHATMEPQNCTVRSADGECEIWGGTQIPDGGPETAAEIVGLKPEKVNFHTTFLGGGFGRARPVARRGLRGGAVAKAAGNAPVKMSGRARTTCTAVSTGRCPPPAARRLDGPGDRVAWQHVLVGQSIIAGTPFARDDGQGRHRRDFRRGRGGFAVPDDDPDRCVGLHSPKSPVPVLWWRSVGGTHTAFAIESLIDELAHAAGQDPVEYRRALLRTIRATWAC